MSREKHNSIELHGWTVYSTLVHLDNSQVAVGAVSAQVKDVALHVHSCYRQKYQSNCLLIHCNNKWQLNTLIRPAVSVWHITTILWYRNFIIIMPPLP